MSIHLEEVNGFDLIQAGPTRENGKLLNNYLHQQEEICSELLKNDQYDIFLSKALSRHKLNNQ